MHCSVCSAQFREIHSTQLWAKISALCRFASWCIVWRQNLHHRVLFGNKREDTTTIRWPHLLLSPNLKLCWAELCQTSFSSSFLAFYLFPWFDFFTCLFNYLFIQYSLPTLLLLDWLSELSFWKVANNLMAQTLCSSVKRLQLWDLLWIASTWPIFWAWFLIWKVAKGELWRKSHGTNPL